MVWKLEAIEAIHEVLRRNNLPDVFKHQTLAYPLAYFILSFIHAGEDILPEDKTWDDVKRELAEVFERYGF